jgi:flavin-dependent dehydrogenase
VVDWLLEEGGRVAGVRGHRVGGGVVELRAPIVIGADGQHSLVARAVRAPTYGVHPSQTLMYYSYWAGVPADGLENYRRQDSLVFVFPTNDDLTLLAVEQPRSHFPAFRTDIEGSLLRAIGRSPRLADRLAAGRRVERFKGTADLASFFRKPYGPGWALVGDAGYFKDPILGQGISDSFRDADLLVGALDLTLTGAAPWEEALGGYERERNAAALPAYELNYRLSTFGVVPATPPGLFTALQGAEEQIDRYFSLSAGTYPIHEFFAEANLARILGAQPLAA